MKKLSYKTAIAFMATVFLMPLYSFAATNTVTTLTDEDNGNLNPANGSGTSLREAINYSASDDTIVFDIGGTNDTIILTNTLTIGKSLTIDGTLPTNAPLIAASQTAAGEYYHDDEPLRVKLDAGLLYRVINTDAPSPITVKLRNMILSKGYDPSYGAGLNVTYLSSVLLDKVSLIYNLTDGYGGGAHADGDLELNDCTLKYNEAYGGGGLAINSAGYARVTDTRFKSNTAVLGGALINYGELKLAESRLSRNTATLSGGALYSGYGNVTIYDSFFAKNTALSEGALFAQSTTVSITNNTFSRNSATNENAAIGISNGDGRIYNSTFFGNWADMKIIEVDLGNFDIDHVTFTSNTVTSGSEIVHSSGTASISNSVIDKAGVLDGTYSLGYNYFGSDHGLSKLIRYNHDYRIQAPLPGSPLIGAGGPSSLTMDQLGSLRGMPSTIGAVEYNNELLAGIWSRDVDDSGKPFGQVWSSSPDYPADTSEFQLSRNGSNMIKLRFTLNPEAISNVVYRLKKSNTLMSPAWGEIASYDASMGSASNANVSAVSNYYEFEYSEDLGDREYFSISYELKFGL
ncbi:CSLREA domain-containing protein [Pontiellaceae bacterium B1224]|nr:CSLREA domain-containing protein [Pontiellaceae bacterium B1224]